MRTKKVKKTNTKRRNKSRRRWFAARLLIECRHPEERVREHLFEDQVILVRARSEEEAFRKAKKLGKTARHQYKNVYGKKVVWALKEVLDVVELFDDVLKEGSEVYYDFLNKGQVRQLRRVLRK